MPEEKANVTEKSLKTPLIISGVIHLVVFLLVIFGLPHFKTEPEIVESIPIDMVADIGEITTATKPPVKAPPKPEKKEEPPPKIEKPKPTPPKQVTPPPEEELKEAPKEDKAVVKDDLAPPKPKEEKSRKRKPSRKSPRRRNRKRNLRRTARISTSFCRICPTKSRRSPIRRKSRTAS